MTIISIPLTKKREAHLDELIEYGVASNREAVMLKALDKLVEYKAIEAVFRAERESIIRGDIRKLLD